jgi:hypothetical protein
MVKHQNGVVASRSIRSRQGAKMAGKTMSEVVTSDAADAKPAVENKPTSDAAFLSARIAKLSGKPAQVEPAPAGEAEANVEAPKEGTTEAEATPPKEVLSKDIEDLTDDEISELAQKGKSGLLKRIAELTAKRKLAEEKAAALELAIAQTRQQLPEAKVEDNPYESIATVEDLQKQKEEVDSFIESAEDILFKAEDLGSDEVVYTSDDGKAYTKMQMREMLRNARRRQTKYIPAHWKELQNRAQRSQMEQQFKVLATNELPWMAGEDNDTRKRYEAMVSDPRLKRAKELVPEIAPQIEYLVAHAANSIYGRRTLEMDSKPKTPALSPPSSPSQAAGSSDRPENRLDRQLKDIEGRYKKTGSANDFIALRAAQISKRSKQ